MNRIPNPKEIKISKSSVKLKLNAKGIASALVRTAMDVNGNIGSGTIPEWIKALGLKEPKEKQIFSLIAKSLMDACRTQMNHRIDQIHIDNNKLVYNNKELQFEIFSGLEKMNITSIVIF